MVIRNYFVLVSAKPQTDTTVMFSKPLSPQNKIESTLQTASVKFHECYNSV